MAKRRPKRRARLTRPKTAREIRNTIKAIETIGQVLREMRSPFGRSEADVAKEIRQRIRGLGTAPSFMPIVASGRNSSFVHHRPGGKIVREDEPVIFDLGAKYRGCCSDITRMHIPDDKRIKRIYSHALHMQKRVIGSIMPGVGFKELHGIYKKLMERKGYKTKHLIGHGIGSVVHERIKDRLEAGMVLTVEPGIYIKRYGGCRVEDMVLVRRGGAKVLSSSIPPLV